MALQHLQCTQSYSSTCTCVLAQGSHTCLALACASGSSVLFSPACYMNNHVCYCIVILGGWKPWHCMQSVALGRTWGGSFRHGVNRPCKCTPSPSHCNTKMIVAEGGYQCGIL